MTVAVYEPTQALSDGLESLSETLRGLDDKALTQALRDIETISRKAQSVMLDLVAEIDSRGIASRAGFGTTRRMLAGVLRLSAGEAKTREEHAALVGTRRTITGQALLPRLPATAAALAEGQIGTGQLRVITEPIGHLYTPGHGWYAASRTRWSWRECVGVGWATGGGLLPDLQCPG